MNIAVDAGSLCVPESEQTGVSTVVFNVLKELIRIDTKNTYLLYSFREIDKKLDSLLRGKNRRENVRVITLTPSSLWLSVRLSLEFLLHPPDVFLAFGQALPFFPPKRSLVFVYDLAFEKLPDLYPDRGRQLRRKTRHAVRHASHIIAISETTKKDLQEIYHISQEKITVMSLGVDPTVFFPQPATTMIRTKKKYRLEDPYFLFVGNARPIKNIGRIIEAFQLFLRQSKKRYTLVFSGNYSLLNEHTRVETQSMAFAGTGLQPVPKRFGSDYKSTPTSRLVHSLGYVPISDLPALYSGATALLMPSLYEGFGLPAVEAMACGCPVIGSTAGSLPEVIQDAGILVDPTDTQAIADAMQQLTVHTSLHERLSKRGIERAKTQSWEKSAKTLFEFL